MKAPTSVKLSHRFLVNYLHHNSILAFWYIDAQNYYDAYQKIFNQIMTESFLKYLRTPMGASDAYNSGFEIIAQEGIEINTKVLYDFFGNLLSVHKPQDNHNYFERTPEYHVPPVYHRAV